MIFVHGAGMNERIWVNQTRDFPDALYPTLVRDLRKEPSVHNFTEYLRSYIKTHSPETTVLAGHSLGAGVALDYALTYPDSVDGLVLISASPKFQVPDQFLTMILIDVNRFIDTIVTMGFSQSADENAKEVFRHVMQEMSPEAIHYDYMCANTFDIQDRISDISVPGVIIAGEQDQMIPLQFAEMLADQLQNAQLNVIPGAGHMVILTQPAMVTQKIKAFLNQL